MTIFKNKVLMITGGTGSFGNAVLNRFLQTDIGEIRIFSRDEKKQDDMRHDFQARMPEVADKIKFFIGDVRDIASVKNAMHDVDYIFHAAALKQVPSCEFFPVEAVKTNVLGTDNVLTAAIESGVKNIVCLSTDKAAYPVNAMGTSKAMMEKVIVAKSRTVKQEKSKICCTRYGNVLCSRGSVVPLWIDQIKAGNPITITEPKMTRFIMSLDEAVDLVLFAFEHGINGDVKTGGSGSVKKVGFIQPVQQGVSAGALHLTFPNGNKLLSVIAHSSMSSKMPFKIAISSWERLMPLPILLPSGDQSRMSYLGSRSFQLTMFS